MNKPAEMKYGEKRLLISDFNRIETDISFKYFRSIMGPMEFAVLIRFMELLIKERLEGNENLMKDFYNSVVNNSSAIFDKSAHNQLNSIDIKQLKELFEVINGDFKEKLEAEKNGQVPSELGATWAYVGSMMVTLDQPLICETLYKLVKGKKGEELCEYFGVTINVLDYPDYNVKMSFQPKFRPFKDNAVIHVATITNDECRLMYDNASDGLNKIVNKKNKITLNCGHDWDLSYHTTVALNKKFDYSEANMALKCPELLCFEMLDEKMARMVLGVQYDDYFKVSERVNKTACIIDGISITGNFKLDDEHYMCAKCLNNYLSVTKHLDKNNKPISIPCPICKAEVTFKQYFKALSKQELIEIQTLLKSSSGVGSKVSSSKTFFCQICSKAIPKITSEIIVHLCNDKVHKNCLKSSVKDQCGTSAIHEIFCKTCATPFPMKTIEELFPSNDPVLVSLISNFNERAITLMCKKCHSFPDDVCLSKQIKCKCGNKFCRLCNSTSDSHKCYPRNEFIDNLAISNNNVRNIFPCPRCLQLNLLYLT